jgi:hypothetical protein
MIINIPFFVLVQETARDTSSLMSLLFCSMPSLHVEKLYFVRLFHTVMVHLSGLSTDTGPKSGNENYRSTYANAGAPEARPLGRRPEVFCCTFVAVEQILNF